MANSFGDFLRKLLRGSPESAAGSQSTLLTDREAPPARSEGLERSERSGRRRRPKRPDGAIRPGRVAESPGRGEDDDEEAGRDTGLTADVFEDDDDDDDAGITRKTLPMPLSRDTNYTPRSAGPVLKRSGDPAREYAQLGAQLIRAIGESNQGLFRQSLEVVLRRVYPFKPIAERIDGIQVTVARIQKAILTKDYGFAAQIASSLTQDASLLTDDVVLMASALLKMGEGLEKTVTDGDLMSASRQIQGLISTAGQFDAAASSRADQLLQLVGRLDRALRTRDFALITSLAGILARDATVVAAFVNEDAAVSPPPVPEAPSLEQMMALIGEQMATRQFTALATAARLMAYRAGLFSDPVMAQALQLNQISRQLRQALLEGKRDVALALSGNIARSAGIFRGPVLERTNHLLDQCLQLEQASQHKDYAAISNLAARVARTADLLTNLQVARASALVQQATKLDQAIRRFDLTSASAALDALPTTR